MSAMGYRQRRADQPLREGDYSDYSRHECEALVGRSLPDDLSNCYVTSLKPTARTSDGASGLWVIGLNAQARVLTLLTGEDWSEASRLDLAPRLFAQFYDQQPIRRRIVTVAQTPLVCLQAVTAIEDNRFLEHQGVSIIGLSRAVLANMIAGRKAQGGSTITQQLVKNYFLSAEKTFSRKLREILMAVILESQVTKDQILEAYLNVIYMGQSGPFQVRGFGAAADYYFNKPLEDLELHECALLAAIINSPGLYNPFSHADRSRERRDLVLRKMREHRMIEDPSLQQALEQPLTTGRPETMGEPAPYYIDALRRELADLGLDAHNGLRVFTALVPEAQRAAQAAVTEGLRRLEGKNKSPSSSPLEASLIVAEVSSARIIALVGGRDFRATQFNRAVQSRRQVGSVMKPLVFLTALEGRDDNGEPYGPLSKLRDEPLRYQYEGQRWEPENYDQKFRGEVPLFVALKDSLNVPTARLAIDVGLPNVIELARRMGVTSDLQPLPSLSLGSFEMSPLEVTQVYSNLARMGRHRPLHLIDRVESLSGDLIYQYDRQPETRVGADKVAQLVGMMKQSLETGTGRIVRQMGFSAPAAGKTGTTSDLRDAWFAGFTPDLVAVVSVGRDDNTPTGLTGASGAAPIWTDLMKRLVGLQSGRDFTWPESVELRTFSLAPSPFGEETSFTSVELVVPR
jgi:penicillin-binding protein 1B